MTLPSAIRYPDPTRDWPPTVVTRTLATLDGSMPPIGYLREPRPSVELLI
jgi:hypothetical protein